MSSAPALEPITDPGTPGAGTGPASPPDPFVPGEVVGERYLLLGRIGHGTSCSVWRARDEVLRRDVAVKRLLGNPAWSPSQIDAARRRAEREGRVAARLHHPRIAAIYDLVEVDGDICLVMELVDAPPLSRLVAGHGPLDPVTAARVGAQVAEGLAAAHAAGVLHRDVKPANVLVGPDGSATLTDFGVAQLVDDVGATTASGRLTGTPHFMAPEIAQGGSASAAADVYALGATLFLALEGQPPTGHGPSGLETLRRVAAGENLPMHRAGPLAPVLARLLDRDPAARPAASHVASLLRSAVGAPAPDRLVAPASPAHPATLVGAPLPDPTPPRPAAAAPRVAVTPVGRPAGRPSADRRRRRIAVGSLLGVAGLAGAVGGGLAITNAASTPLAAEGATVVPPVQAPITPPAVPVSAPPITPAPDEPITDLGPTVEPPAPALVVQANPSAGSFDSSSSDDDGDDGDDDGHRSDRGRHRSDDDHDHDRHDKDRDKHRSRDSDDGDHDSDHGDRDHGKHDSDSDDD